MVHRELSIMISGRMRPSIVLLLAALASCTIIAPFADSDLGGGDSDGDTDGDADTDTDSAADADSDAGLCRVDLDGLTSVATYMEEPTGTYDDTPIDLAPYGVLTLRTAWTNLDTTGFEDLVFEITELNPGERLYNADCAPSVPPTTRSVPPENLGADHVLFPGEMLSIDFEIAVTEPVGEEYEYRLNGQLWGRLF
jgi:hypothetical protein